MQGEIMKYVFVHMHRVLGTSIVSMMKREGVQFYKPNMNGNPAKKEKNGLIKIWTFSRKRMNEFYKSCEEQGCEAICHEWGFPPLSTLHLDEYNYFTMLRDPLDRIISCYNRHSDFSKEEKKPINEYYHQGRLCMEDNYYTRLLARKDKYEGVTWSDYETAKNVLKKFNAVMIMENKNTWKQFEDIGLSKDLPWLNKPREKIYTPDYEFEKKFIEENKYDYLLYDWCKVRARELT